MVDVEFFRQDRGHDLQILVGPFGSHRLNGLDAVLFKVVLQRIQKRFTEFIPRPFHTAFRVSRLARLEKPRFLLIDCRGSCI